MLAIDMLARILGYSILASAAIAVIGYLGVKILDIYEYVWDTIIKPRLVKIKNAWYKLISESQKWSARH